MSWNRNSRPLGAVGALVLLAGAAQADVLVVRSSGPSAAQYAPGRSLPDAGRVTLKAGDRLTLLDSHGTRTLAGPGAFPVAAPPGGATAANDTRLAAFLGRGSQQRVRIGAVRGITAVPPHAPTLWSVDTSRAGTTCVADPTAVTLWRPDPSADATLAIAGPSGRATVAWTVGQSTAPWPAALQVTSGASYTLAWSGGSARRSLRIEVVDPAAVGIADTAAALIRKGCSAQVDLLVDVAATPTG